MLQEVKVAKPASPPMDGLPFERRIWAVVAISVAVAMASLDTAIANVALPAIAADLKVSPADAVWVVNVYQIALVATLLPLGALGEIVGHQRIYLGGLLLFTVASLGCACAWSLPSLLVWRILQGLGASGLMSVNSALIRFIYPSRMLGRGYGYNAMVVGTAFTFGPTVASSILAFGTWPWLFAVNIPFGLVAMAIGILGVGSAAHKAQLGLVSAELVLGLVLGIVLIRRQADHPAPMLPIDLFRRPMFALSAATAVCSFAIQGIGFVSLPFYFEDVLHRTQVATGFFMTPWPLVTAIMAPVAGRLSDRYPVGLLGGVGLVLLGIGMALLAMLPAEPSIFNIVWRMAICGFGFGFFQTPNLRAIMSSAPPGRSGGASGIVATARLTGQTTGAALAALCFALFGREGATVALALGAGFAAVGSVMSFLRLTIPATKP